MELKRDNITFFLFGSPADGFSVFPPESGYLDMVRGLDNSSGKGRKCTYSLHQNGFKLFYVEYGLSGINNSENNRSGRNFGVWLEVKGVEMGQEGVEKLRDYVFEFLEEGIVQKGGLFKVSHDGLKHYIIKSFMKQKHELSHLIDSFVKNFINGFDKYTIPLTGNQGSLDLLKPPKIKGNTLKEEIKQIPVTTKGVVQEAKISRHDQRHFQNDEEPDRKIEKEEGADEIANSPDSKSHIQINIRKPSMTNVILAALLILSIVLNVVLYLWATRNSGNKRNSYTNPIETHSGQVADDEPGSK